jgi:hypothetical protein
VDEDKQTAPSANLAVQQLKAAISRLLQEGRAEGIEPDGPLGFWLEAQAEALSGFAAVLEGQASRFEEVLGQVEAANRSELEKVEAANRSELKKLEVALELAGEAVKQGELSVRHARNAQLAAVVQQENAVQRMIEETLPMFAERLKGALVIREARWNRAKARRGFALAGSVFLAVFCAGYGLSWWSSGAQLDAYDRCINAPFASTDGHIYCRLDATNPPPAKDRN